MPQLKDTVYSASFKPILIENSEVNGESVVLVKGLFQLADEPNQNKRVYPEALWDRIVNDPKIQQRIKEDRMVGTLDHPKTGITELKEVSHTVTALEKVGKQIIGTAKILNTPNGKVLRELIASGVPVGVSSRGSGTTRNDESTGYQIVNDDYKLDTFDFVANPSTPGAYPTLVQEDAKVVGGISEGSSDQLNYTEVRSTMSTNITQELNTLRTNIQKWKDIPLNVTPLQSLYELSERIYEAEVRTYDLAEAQPNYKPLIESFRKELQELGAIVNKAVETQKISERSGISSAEDIKSIVESTLRGVLTHINENSENSDDSDNNESDMALHHAQDDYDKIYRDFQQAKDIMESQDDQIDRLKVQLNEREGKIATLQRDLQAIETLANQLKERYEVAVNLLEAFRSRYYAAKEVIEELMQEKQRGEIEAYVESVLRDNPNADNYRPLLYECATKEKVDERYAELQKIVESVTKGYPEDLPNLYQRLRNEQGLDSKLIRSNGVVRDRDGNLISLRPDSFGHQRLNEAIFYDQRRTIPESDDPTVNRTHAILNRMRSNNPDNPSLIR